MSSGSSTVNYAQFASDLRMRAGLLLTGVFCKVFPNFSLQKSKYWLQPCFLSQICIILPPLCSPFAVPKESRVGLLRICDFSTSRLLLGGAWLGDRGKSLGTGGRVRSADWTKPLLSKNAHWTSVKHQLLPTKHRKAETFITRPSTHFEKNSGLS